MSTLNLNVNVDSTETLANRIKELSTSVTELIGITNHMMEQLKGNYNPMSRARRTVLKASDGVTTPEMEARDAAWVEERVLRVIATAGGTLEYTAIQRKLKNRCRVMPIKQALSNLIDDGKLALHYDRTSKNAATHHYVMVRSS